MGINQRRYEEALQQGLANNAQGDWQRALRNFRVALTVAPEAPEVYAGLGEACFGLKRLDRALESYKLAARFSRGDLRYLERVADLQERLGQLREAARTYMAAGELQLRQRQLEQAISNWERAVRLDPGLLGAHRRLAMVHQRQGNARGAVREYLAIARTLQAQGQDRQALQMCRAALRLDPGNEDALMAMRLVREGEDDSGLQTADRGQQTAPSGQPSAVSGPAPAASGQPSAPGGPAPASEELTEAETVRQIAAAFEEERRQWQAAQAPRAPADPLAQATQRAQDELAEEIFREEKGEADLYGVGPQGLSKLERDALIGQGIDFHSRGDAANALLCFERAVAGGLRLPAAYFTLGLLYMETGRKRHARAALARAGQDPSYREAIRMAMKGRPSR